LSNQNTTKRNNNGGIVPSSSGGGGSSSRRQLAQKNPTYLANNLDRMFEDFRTSFNQLMTPFVTSPLSDPFYAPSLTQDWTETAQAGLLPTRYPVLDVLDEGDYYTVTAELPGFNKENVDIQVGDDILQLRAQMQTEQNKGNGKSYVSRERAYSSFQRAIQFPEHIIASKVEGTMKDGVLSLRIPKKKEPTSTTYMKVALK
jgi:HSP20 family molecular chaperone IbpA